MIVVMVRIPVGSPAEGEQMAGRFANRAGLVDGQPGFLGFELLRGDGELVSVTRWQSREDLDRWMNSQAHGQAHARHGAHPSGEQTQASGQGAQAGPRASSTTIYEVVIPGGSQS